MVGTWQPCTQILVSTVVLNTVDRSAGVQKSLQLLTTGGVLSLLQGYILFGAHSRKYPKTKHSTPPFCVYSLTILICKVVNEPDPQKIVKIVFVN